jgi:CheY-like chemotaxis protein
LKSGSSKYKWDDFVFLITEDEDVNFIYLKALLKKTSARIIRARNGQEAVEIINRGTDRIDLILMDINMPVMDGYEATRRIKSYNPKIPIVAQTAYAWTYDRKEWQKAGFIEYLTKPIRSQTLLSLIHNLLNGNYQSN